MKTAFALAALLAVSARAQAPASDPFDDALRSPKIALGPLKIVGEDHPNPDLADFPLLVEGKAPGLTASWVEGSVRWIRPKDGMPVPRGRLLLSVSAPPERVLVRWRGRTVQLQGGPDGSSVELFAPLLNGGAAEIEIDGKPAAKVRVGAVPRANAAHAIDHTCSPWRLKFDGLDDAFLVASCRVMPVGPLGGESASLEVRWAASGVAGPMTAQLRRGRPARATVTGPDGKPRVVELTASVPERLHRARVAWGAGPYNLSSSGPSGNGVTGSAMLYGNFRLRHEDNLSIRAFEAAVGRDPGRASFFNNLGAYFAYDAVRAVDARLRLTILLGAQIVTFAPNGLARPSHGEVIAPQGFELSYPDAFGFRNKSLSGGIFVQPTTATKRYSNVWIRWGGRWFSELNYISWRDDRRFATMWGFSVGAPLAQFF